MRPDCHLVRTAILFLPGIDSLGDFHRSPSVSLASFARRVSGGNRVPPLWPEQRRVFPHSPTPRKAGYVCTQRYGPKGPMHRIAGSQSVSYTGRKYHKGVRLCTRTGLHENRVGLTMPLESALSSQAQACASPQHPPKTGRIKQAPRVSSMCPSEDF